MYMDSVSDVMGKDHSPPFLLRHTRRMDMTRVTPEEVGYALQPCHSGIELQDCRRLVVPSSIVDRENINILFSSLSCLCLCLLPCSSALCFVRVMA